MWSTYTARVNGMSDHHQILTQLFLDPEAIFSSHTMFINASTEALTLTHLVTCSISRSRIRMKFYFVYRRNVCVLFTCISECPNAIS